MCVFLELQGADQGILARGGRGELERTVSPLSMWIYAVCCTKDNTKKKETTEDKKKHLL
jgi:hypothetical protein